jgi:hypothetical protein
VTPSYVGAIIILLFLKSSVISYQLLNFGRKMSTTSYSTLIIADNPTLSELKLSWATMEFTAVDGIGPMRSLYEAGDSLVAVAKFEKDGVTIIGSGVMIGPGLLLTATHVLDDFKQNKDFPTFLTFLPHAARAWLPVETSTVSGKSDFDESRRKVSDISLVSCTLNSAAYEDIPLMLAPLKVTLPMIGERFWAFGFRHQFINDGAASVTPLVSSGVVTAVFPQGRGERMPSPCFEVEMDTPGGMSGGAVANAEGDVVGIVSSSIEGGPTYVTLIWDALRYTIKGSIPALMEREEINLLYVKQLGLAKIKGKVTRKPWGDVVFTMSDEEFKLALESSASPEFELNKNVLTGDQLDKFYDEWGYDLEKIASAAAVEYLENLPTNLMHEFLSASGVSQNLLDLIQQHTVEDFEGVEDPEVLSTERLSETKIYISYYFNLLTVVWRVEVSEKSYLEHESDLAGGIVNVNFLNGTAFVEILQRCDFKMTVVFDEQFGEFSEESITWSAVRIPKKRAHRIQV